MGRKSSAALLLLLTSAAWGEEQRPVQAFWPEDLSPAWNFTEETGRPIFSHEDFKLPSSTSPIARGGHDYDFVNASPRGAYALLRDKADGKVIVWDAEARALKASFAAKLPTISDTGLVFADGKLLDGRDGKVLRQVSGFSGDISGDGKLLSHRGKGKWCVVEDALSGKETARFNAPCDYSRILRNKVILMGIPFRGMTLGVAAARLDGKDKGVRLEPNFMMSAALSADGRFLLYADCKGEIRLQDMARQETKLHWAVPRNWRMGFRDGTLLLYPGRKAIDFSDTLDAIVGTELVLDFMKARRENDETKAREIDERVVALSAGTRTTSVPARLKGCDAKGDCEAYSWAPAMLKREYRFHVDPADVPVLKRGVGDRLGMLDADFEWRWKFRGCSRTKATLKGVLRHPTLGVLETWGEPSEPEPIGDSPCLYFDPKLEKGSIAAVAANVGRKPAHDVQLTFVDGPRCLKAEKSVVVGDLEPGATRTVRLKAAGHCDGVARLQLKEAAGYDSALEGVRLQ